jgi:hypothetical protein
MPLIYTLGISSPVIRVFSDSNHLEKLLGKTWLGQNNNLDKKYKITVEKYFG